MLFNMVSAKDISPVETQKSDCLVLPITSSGLLVSVTAKALLS